jgi:hypothetical protein
MELIVYRRRLLSTDTPIQAIVLVQLLLLTCPLPLLDKHVDSAAPRRLDRYRLGLDCGLAGRDAGR